MNQKINSSQTVALAQGRYSFSSQSLLGKGATGNVYKGYDHETRKEVAVKVIETGKMNQVERSLIENEKKALKMLKHDNIMKLFHIQEQGPFTYIISELYEGGSLKEHLEKRGRFNEQQAMEFFRKIVHGYCAVVQANVIHRDLKPTNILLTKHNEPVIIDFGYSQIIVTNRNLTVFNVGSPSYMSPEAYKKTIYSQKSDVWSLGAIFYELIMNTTLDHNIPTQHYFDSLMNSEYPQINFDLFGDIPKQILQGTLAVKPEKRITSHRIKYLLDKQILGKKLLNKMIVKTDTQQPVEKKVGFAGIQSMKNFEFLTKEIDFTSLRQEEQNKNMKRKPATTKTFSSFPIPTSQSSSFKGIPINSVELVQVLSAKKSESSSMQQFSQAKTNPASLNATPSLSRIQFKPSENKNSMSTINYVERQRTPNKNITSSLVINNLRESKKCTSTLKFQTRMQKVSSVSIRQQINEMPGNTSNLQMNHEYFNESRNNMKHLTYNQGFFRTQNQNFNSMNLSMDKRNMSQLNMQPLYFSGDLSNYQKSNCDQTKTQQSYNSSLISDLSNTLTNNKKSSKKISFADYKDPQKFYQQMKPQQNARQQQNNKLNSSFQCKNNQSSSQNYQNTHSQLNFKSSYSAGSNAIRQQLDFNSKRAENLVYSENNFHMRQPNQQQKNSLRNSVSEMERLSYQPQPNNYSKLVYQPQQYGTQPTIQLRNPQHKNTNPQVNVYKKVNDCFNGSQPLQFQQRPLYSNGTSSKKIISMKRLI